MICSVSNHFVTNKGMLSVCVLLNNTCTLQSDIMIKHKYAHDYSCSCCDAAMQNVAQQRGTHLEVIDIAPAARTIERTSAVMVHCTRHFVFHNAVHIGDGLREE